MAEGERPALYHVAVDQQAANFYRDAQRLAGDRNELSLVVKDEVDVVVELDADEVMMKLRAIDCHRSQHEDWRIAIREHPRLMQLGYGHEPYIAAVPRVTAVTAGGLFGEFA
jgi:hypothetical protein